MTANRKKAPEYLKDDHLSVGTKAVSYTHLTLPTT